MRFLLQNIREFSTTTHLKGNIKPPWKINWQRTRCWENRHPKSGENVEKERENIGPLFVIQDWISYHETRSRDHSASWE